MLVMVKGFGGGGGGAELDIIGGILDVSMNVLVAVLEFEVDVVTEVDVMDAAWPAMLGELDLPKVGAPSDSILTVTISSRLDIALLTDICLSGNKSGMGVDLGGGGGVGCACGLEIRGGIMLEL